MAQPKTKVPFAPQSVSNVLTDPLQGLGTQASPPRPNTITVKKGDTLGKIARLNNLSVSDLAIANNIKNPNKIGIGQKLVIPNEADPFSATELKTVAKTGKPVYDTKQLYKGFDESKVDNEAVVRGYYKGKEPFILIDKKTNTLKKFDADGLQVVRNPTTRDKYDKVTPENIYDYAVSFYNKPEAVRLGKASGNNTYVQSVNSYTQNFVPTNNEQPTGLISDVSDTYSMKKKYASGGSIHIDPANKGKFNATKKRTGKTTEELTHSSNPLTRKRAIFAQNAAKWHHATGGEISSGQQLANGIGGLSGLLGMVNPIAGAAAAALPALASLFKAPDKTVISASPGNYSSGGLTGLLPQEAFAGAQPPQMSKGSFASGGPTDPPARDNTYVHPKPIQALVNAPRNFQVVPDPMAAVPLAIEAMQNQQTINPLHVPGITTSGKSLSKPRFREHATGGDVQLASDAFQVKGNPNVTDGNTYGDVKLDHNEVVTKTQQGGEFVFSDDLKHSSGLSYAKVAAKHSEAKGKAEKILKMSPYDEQAKSTISQSNALLEQLANQQEAQATKMGLRNNDGSTKQHFATGGSTDGPGDPIYISIPAYPDYFYDPYQGRMLRRDTNTGQYQDIGLTKKDAASYLPPNVIQNHLAKYPQTAATPTTQQQPIDPNFFANRTYEGLGEPRVLQTVTPQVGTPTGSTTPKSRSSKPIAKLNAVPSWLTKARAYMKGAPTSGEQQPPLSDVFGLKSTSANPYTSTPEQRLKIVDPNFAEGEWTANHDQADTPTMDMSNYSAAKTSTDTNYKTPWTFGDTLKAIELGAKGIGAFGKAEKEAPLLDNTQITQQTYDPTNALYQNQRSFQNFANSATGSTSINMRRGLLNSALANRYSSDNNVLSQYQQMNQGAKTDFQQRSSAQRQFNVQSQFNTNNINAANRAAQDALQQNFFTSVGQFGEDLNRKRYATDTINLFKQQFPDIFNSYISSIQ